MPTHFYAVGTNVWVMTNVTVEQFWGTVMAKAVDKAGMEHRWWFDETDGGRIVCMAEVIDHTDDNRHFVPKSRISVPEPVSEAVCQYHDVDEVYVV